jgi:hypothetical protein
MWRAGLYHLQHTWERRALQIAVVLACLVPLLAGASGMISGTAMLDCDPDPAMGSQFRYLSGLLFGLGLAFLTAVPGIERKSERFHILTGLVVIGGLARLASAIMVQTPPLPMQLALVMELLVTPALLLWQRRISAGARTYVTA